MRVSAGAICVAAILASASMAEAAPILITVGDNDGYGKGVADNGNLGAFSFPFKDNRSAAEVAATDGAQITDVYSAIDPFWGPNSFSSASVFFPFSGVLSSATLTIDMGDFESFFFGSILANINGVALNLAFQDGLQNSVVRSFALTAAQLAAANSDGSVILNLNRGVSVDFIGFDYFELNGEVSTVPEPSMLLLMGTGLAALARLRAKTRRRASIDDHVARRNRDAIS